MATEGHIEVAEPARMPDGVATGTNEGGICQWQPPFYWQTHRCHMPVDAEDTSHCILHNPDEHKNLSRFIHVLRDKIWRDESDPDVEQVALFGIVFPRADFATKRFNKAVDFSDAKFINGVSFRGTQFGAEADFRRVVFGDNAHFTNCIFGKDASFIDTQFHGKAIFSGAVFGDGRANFDRTVFEEETVFTSAKFNGITTFFETKFQHRVLFWGTNFNDGVWFLRAHFAQEAGFVGTRFVAEANFESMTLDANVRFDHLALGNVSFFRSDVSNLSLIGCTWARKSEPVLWPLPIRWPGFMLQSRSVLSLENEIKEKPVPPGIEPIEEDDHGLIFGDDDGPIFDDYEMGRYTWRWNSETYRQLRSNFESNRQAAEAGDFYIGQMEMRRKDKTSPRLQRWFLLPAYRVLAMYGESYVRPVIFYFTLSLLFAPVYLWGGYQIGLEEVKYALGWDLGNALVFGIDYVGAYVQALTAGGILAVNLASGAWWVPLVRFANMLVDIFLVGFFVIALRRHFRR